MTRRKTLNWESSLLQLKMLIASNFEKRLYYKIIHENPFLKQKFGLTVFQKWFSGKNLKNRKSQEKALNLFLNAFSLFYLFEMQLIQKDFGNTSGVQIISCKQGYFTNTYRWGPSNSYLLSDRNTASLFPPQTSNLQL